MAREREDEQKSPWLVLHIPHSATRVPDDLRGQFVLDDEKFALEQLLMVDRFTDELFAPATPATRVVFPVSRLLVDPERFRDDAMEPMAARGMGAIYERTSGGEPLRARPPPSARQELLARFYDPHHRLLESAVTGAIAGHSFCLVLDCHSFPSRALPYETDQREVRAEICVGTDDCHTPPWLRELVVTVFAGAGLDVALNRPFEGAMVPASRYRTRDAVMALMIEVRRDLYMDETTGVRRADFPVFKKRLNDLVDIVCAGVVERQRRTR